MSAPTSVCALPGCPNLAHGQVFNRGYCDVHGSHAIVEALEDVSGHLAVLTTRVDQIARILEEPPKG